MRTRAAASVALATLVLFGTTACGYIAPQATLDVYDPSDGVNATVGDIRVLNAMVFTEDGAEANFVAGVLNKGSERIEVTLQYEAGGEKVDTEFTVGASDSVSIGNSDDMDLVLEDIDAKPGDLFPVFVQYGDTPGKQLLVPVLDATMSQYEHLVP